jgi:hypothetical protein
MDGPRKVLVLLLTGLLAACASSGSRGSSPMGDPDVITREQIGGQGSARNAYDLVQSLRPQWLITRGLTTLRQAAGEEDVVVYMDNGRLGYRDELRRVPLGSVQYLRFFSASEATQRWGAGHLHGAILISTQRPD